MTARWKLLSKDKRPSHNLCQIHPAWTFGRRRRYIITTLAVIYFLTTRVRKIRAYYRGKKCNATFPKIKILIFFKWVQENTANSSNKACRFSYNMRICLSSTHFVPNTYNVIRLRHRILLIVRILSVENDATKGTRQTTKSKCILMLHFKI